MHVRIRPRRALLGAIFAAAMVISAIAASSASAVLKQLPDGQVTSYQPMRTTGPVPFDTVFNNMDYNGGPVMPSNTDYYVFWSPTGAKAYPPGYVRGLEQYFRDLAHDSGGNQNTDSVATQYNDLTGASAKYDMTFGGGLFDRDPYPASGCPVHFPVVQCLTDGQIQQELENFVHSKGLPD